MRAADIARLTLLAAIWGSSFMFIKVALQGFDPVEVVAGRVVLGALALLVVARLLGRHTPRQASTWRAVAIMALVASVIPFLLITWSEERIASGTAAILNSTTPLFTAVFAAALLPQERLGATRAAGIALGFVGVAVIVGGNAPEEALGALAVVLASASYGAGFVFARVALTRHQVSPVALSAGQLGIASVLTVPPATWNLASSGPRLSPGPIASLVFLGVVGTGFAYVIYYRLVADIGPTSSSMVTYLIPVFGVAFGAAFLDEQVGWGALVGAALVIGGIALAHRRRDPLEGSRSPRSKRVDAQVTRSPRR